MSGVDPSFLFFFKGVAFDGYPSNIPLSLPLHQSNRFGNVELNDKSFWQNNFVGNSVIELLACHVPAIKKKVAPAELLFDLQQTWCVVYAASSSCLC